MSDPFATGAGVPAPGVPGGVDARLQGTASNPGTDGRELAAVAYGYPVVQAVVAANPATYPGLLAWLAQYGTADARAIATRRLQLLSFPPPTPTTSPAPAPMAPRASAATRWKLVLAAVAIAVTAVLFVTGLSIGLQVLTPHAQKPVAAPVAPPATTAPPRPPSGEPLYTADQASGVYLTPSEAATFGTSNGAALETSTVGEAAARLQATVATEMAGAGGPRACDFVFSDIPAVGTEAGALLGQPVTSEKGLLTIGTSTVTQSTRLFANAAEVTEYLASLKSSVEGCRGYTSASFTGTVGEQYVDSHALSEGWVAKGTGPDAGRVQYVLDIAHDNLVTRLIVTLSPDDAAHFSEARVENLAVKVADNVLAITAK